MRKPTAIRNILVVADPYTAGRALLSRLDHSGFATFDMDEGRETLLSQVEAHFGEGDGRPLAVLVETSGSIQEVTAAARDLQHILATPICVRITRQDRALQTVLEKQGEKYNYTSFRKRMLSNTRIQTKMATVLPQGKDAALTEVANEALRKNWKLEMRRLGAYLGITLAIGEEETGLEYETSANLSLADRFRTELSNGGKPGNAVQPVLGGGGVRSGGRKYNEATGNSAQLKMGDKLRPPAITAQQSQAMREARGGGKQSKIPRHSVGGGGGPRQPDPGKGPVMGERTRAVKNKQQIVAKPVGREEGMNAARQLSRRPVGESSANAKAQNDAAQAVAQSARKQVPVKTKTEGRNGDSNGYWDGRKKMSYYGEAVKLACKYAPNARTLLDVGGRDCLYTLDVPAELRVTVDPDRGPNNPGIRWVQADFMQWQADQIYDVAFCLQVMEHIPDAANFLKKLLMVARVVVVSVPFNWPPTPDHTHHRLKSDVFENWADRKPDYLVKIKENGRPPSYSKRVMAVFIQNFPAPQPQAPMQPAISQPAQPAQEAAAPQIQPTLQTQQAAPPATEPPAETLSEETSTASSNGSAAEVPASTPIPQIQIQRDDSHPF